MHKVDSAQKTSATQDSAYKLIGAGGRIPTEGCEEVEIPDSTGAGGAQAEDLIEFEFKVSGMSCVNCSANIERKFHAQYDEKELKSVTIVLLVHKLIAVFPQRVFSSRAVTPQAICEFVTGIGFACELLGMAEISEDRDKTKRGGLERADSSDSLRIRGLNASESEIERADDEKQRTPGSSSTKAGGGGDSGTSARRGTATQIKRSTITVWEKQEGLLEKSATDRICETLTKMPGVLDCQVETSFLPNLVRISHKIDGTPLREIIAKLHELGYPSATYKPQQEDNSLKDSLEREVKHFRKKFLIALIVEIPILVLMWVIPYTNPDFLTDHIVFNGMPLYIFLLLGLSSIIQFGLGIDFYRRAFKSVKGCSANMDVLVVLGTTAAWTYGLILIFIGDHAYGTSLHETVEDHSRHSVHEHAHNFEIAATLIAVILFGKLLESVTKKQTVDKLQQLASLKVSKATLMKDGATLADAGEETDVDLLVVGDIIKVINGQTVPIDGVVVAGDGLVNESMLTGEAKPVNKERDSKVYGGTMLLRGTLLVKVDRLAELSAIN